jgi:hypothetical protein
VIKINYPRICSHLLVNLHGFWVEFAAFILFISNDVIFIVYSLLSPPKKLSLAWVHLLLFRWACCHWLFGKNMSPWT